MLCQTSTNQENATILTEDRLQDVLLIHVLFLKPGTLDNPLVC